MIAFAAAIIGSILGFFVSYVLNYSDFILKRLIDVLSLVALAVPGVVLGIGYIFVWNQRWIEAMGLKMYGTPKIIVLASVAAAIPVITRVLTGGMAKIPRPILFAARLSGAGLITRIRTILWPLLKATVLSAFLSAFGGSVFNLAINTILYPPNYQTLPVYISKGVENLKFGYSAAATVFGGGIVVLLILVMELLGRDWKRKPENARKTEKLRGKNSVGRKEASEKNVAEHGAVAGAFTASSSAVSPAKSV